MISTYNTWCILEKDEHGMHTRPNQSPNYTEPSTLLDKISSTWMSTNSDNPRWTFNYHVRNIWKLSLWIIWVCGHQENWMFQDQHSIDIKKPTISMPCQEHPTRWMSRHIVLIAEGAFGFQQRTALRIILLRKVNGSHWDTKKGSMGSSGPDSWFIGGTLVSTIFWAIFSGDIPAKT